MDNPGTQTPAAPAGNLPIDFKGDVDGNVRITRGQEVTPPAAEAREGETPSKEQKPAQPQATIPTPAPVKTFTEEEVNLRIETLKGGHKGTVDKMRVELEKAQSRIAELEEENSQKEYENWLRAIQESGDEKSVDYFKRVAAMDKATKAKASELKKREAELNVLKLELDEAGKSKFVGDQIKKYGLTEDVFDTLYNIEDRGEIRAKAAELALEKARTAAVPPVQTDGGAVKPTPRDLSKLPDNVRLGILMEESLQK
jgi:hypothetical protein